LIHERLGALALCLGIFSLYAFLMLHRNRRPLWRLIGLFVFVCFAQAQGQERYDIGANYEKQEHMIPMRDGVRLFTSIYRPKDTSRRYPFLITRTPYGVGPYGADNYKSALGPHEGYARHGYIFVYQDVRGQFMSEGEWVQVRPHLVAKSGAQDIDESTDTFDTVEWLLSNVDNHNGRAGIWGISYPGFYTAAGIIDGHPAIKAASPQAALGDWFRGDDFHHNGAFFLQDAFNFLTSVGRPRTEPRTTFPPPFNYESQDAYDFFLRMGPLPQAELKYLKGEIPFWTEMMEHGNYDEFWQKRNIIPHLKNVKAAVLSVAGWFDAEDPYGPIKIYQSIERQNPAVANSLVIGPWTHGGWAWSDGDRLGQISFEENTGDYYRTRVELPFFEHYLRDEARPELPEALVFVTGSNAWKSFPAWPPSEAQPLSLYLRSDGGLSFEPPAPAVEPASNTFPSDPAKPVPYTSEIRITRSVEYMVEDQRFASRRPDVLVYQTAALDQDVTLVGPVVPELFVATSGTDADFVVKLIDVFPDDHPPSAVDSAGTQEKCVRVPLSGYQMLVRGEVMRAKFRNSFEHPEPMVPGQVTRVRFEMPDIAHTFKRGHRIMVQIQSSWFPLVDRNPQTFVDIYRASEEDFERATHTVNVSAEKPSRLIVNRLER
jgi:uncharacterized protein